MILHRNRYFLKTTRAGSESGFGDEISGSGKKIRIRNTAAADVSKRGMASIHLDVRSIMVKI
jgi:hypothetical protein